MANTNSLSSGFVSKVLITIFCIVLVFIIIALFYKIPHILLSIFASILFAVFIDSLIRLINRKVKISRGWSILLIIMLMFGLGVISWIFLGPPIMDQFSKLGQSIPKAIDELNGSMEKSSIGKTILESFPKVKDSALSGQTVMTIVGGALFSIVELSEDALIIFLLGIFFASNPSLYIDSMLYLLSKEKREHTHKVVSHIGHALRIWMLGRIIIMVVVTILTSVGLWIIGMPLAFALGLITGLLSFIPYFGAFIAFVPVVLIALAESSSMALYAGLVYTVLHIVEGYILTPIIQQYIVSLPPVVLIVSQVIMLDIFGTLGILIATPAVLILIIIIQMLYLEDILKEKVKILGS